MNFLIGIDEAGRGPLAGPVAVGAVIVSCDFDWSLVAGAKDSKQMTSSGREEIYEIMCRLRNDTTINFAVAFSSAAVIDARGIIPAIQSALNRALSKMTEVRPRHIRVLLDGGLHAPKRFANQETIIRGDQSEPVISLASIVAKVERDRLMKRLSVKYPLYGFEIHKGYGTAAHRKIIALNGLSPIHRKSFCSRI
ncbi:MAG TPA: ribonuclease HII [Candidatus Paceibacterota bacterium]|nr:ribonuclease HII [Candidatus Paceibacterota bacterium]